MTYNYTLSCNHGEYLEGLFKNETDAYSHAEFELLNDGVDYQDISDAKHAGEFDELLDGYGYRIAEILQKQKTYYTYPTYDVYLDEVEKYLNEMGIDINEFNIVEDKEND